MQTPSFASPSPKLLIGLPFVALVALVCGVTSIAALSVGAQGCGGGGETVGALSPEVPRRLVPIYGRAAAKYGLGQKGASVLAAINFVESSFGTNMATSSAGANGWMAFLPSTWEVWGVDGDRDGDKDPYDAFDAIHSAANYLRDSGAPEDWHGAIFAYNHAEWYVEKVLRYAGQFAASDGEGVLVAAASGCETAGLPPNEAVARMLAEADRLSAIRPRTEYVYGGSHGISPTPPNGPFDCSSAVSHLLQVGGFDNSTMDTIALLGWAEPGAGRWLTIWDKPYGKEAHTFIEFKPGITPASKRFWGTSGMFERGHGPGWIPEGVFSAEYLSGFVQLHPAGL